MVIRSSKVHPGLCLPGSPSHGSLSAEYAGEGAGYEHDLKVIIAVKPRHTHLGTQCEHGEDCHVNRDAANPDQGTQVYTAAVYGGRSSVTEK